MREDGQTHMTKLTVAFRNSVKASKCGRVSHRKSRTEQQPYRCKSRPQNFKSYVVFPRLYMQFDTDEI